MCTLQAAGVVEPVWPSLLGRMGLCASSSELGFQNMKLRRTHCSELGKLIKNSIESET